MEWIKIHWDEIAVAYLLFHKILVTIRDVYDKTPDSDDNVFEKFVTLIGKMTSYFVTGRRVK